LAYIRRTPEEAFLVALNLGDGPFELSLVPLGLTGRMVLSTHLDRTDEGPVTEVGLRAAEGVIIALA
jgi:hypothetical protein